MNILSPSSTGTASRRPTTPSEMLTQSVRLAEGRGREAIVYTDIESYERYCDRIHWESARIIATSATHGIVIAADKQLFGHIRVALLGTRGGRLFRSSKRTTALRTVSRSRSRALCKL